MFTEVTVIVKFKNKNIFFHKHKIFQDNKFHDILDSLVY